MNNHEFILTITSCILSNYFMDFEEMASYQITSWTLKKGKGMDINASLD